MRVHLILIGVVTASLAIARPALAQRFSFERSFDVTEPAALDVSTIRGKIDVTTGAAGKIVVTGTVTVRVAWDVPANAVEIAKRIAASPPVQGDPQTVTLRAPADATERRAVTVAYSVQVPATTRVLASSQSGATSVRGVRGPVTVRTQSGAIDLAQLGGATEVVTGSGAVTIAGVSDALPVTTASGGISAQSLGGPARIRTQSGAVVAAMTGDGDADVQTGSSGIRISGARGALTASTQSGHVIVSGVPGRPWTATTGSGALDLDIESKAFDLDATTGSGSVKVQGGPVSGSLTNRKATGTVGAGGPLVRLTSRSGSVHLRIK